jgi:hypothetical protein
LIDTRTGDGRERAKAGARREDVPQAEVHRSPEARRSVERDNGKETLAKIGRSYVCKITDPAKSGEKENLTTEFLLTHYDFTMEPQKAQELKELNEKMQVFRSKLLPARNKLISHYDRNSCSWWSCG